MESSLPYENRKAAQAELAEKKAFLAGLEKAFKEAEESYNRISRRVSDAQARLEALRAGVAEEGRQRKRVCGRGDCGKRDCGRGPGSGKRAGHNASGRHGR